MKSYYTYRRELNEEAALVEVKPEIKYYSYKDGKATIFDTWDEAHKHSKLVEKMIVNQVQVNQYKSKVSEIDNKAFDLWFNELKTDFSINYPKLIELSENCFDVIYEKAYERGHHAGYDEVANYFESEASYLEEAFVKCEIIK